MNFSEKKSKKSTFEQEENMCMVLNRRKCLHRE